MVSYLITTMIFRGYLNAILKHNYIYDLLTIVAIIVILSIFEKLFNYFRDRVTTRFKLKVNTNIKNALYKHMLNLEYDSYNSYDKAEIMQRINEDADVYSKFFNSQFNVILDVLFLSILTIIEGITLNLEVSLYIFFSIIVMLLFSLWYYKKLGISIDNMIIQRKKLLNATINNANNFKFIRMFNKQKEEKENYKTLNNARSEKEIKFIKLVLFYDIILEHITYLKTPIIYALGGIAIINGKMTMGTLVAIHSLAERIFDCIYSFGDNLDTIDDFQIVTKKLNQLLKLKEEIRENELYDLNGEIIFSNVTIYVNSQIILKDINFIISKGEKVAIIGENGSGKSILAKTILGFYKYDGNIYINNHNIKRLNKENIRKYVELVLEDYMFSGSILQNIELDKDIKQEVLEQVLLDCDIKDDINEFKEGYNTQIGEKGIKLSGGQKQRICLARTLVSDKPILVLDEGLNKLDNKTRANVLSRLTGNYSDKTIIFVSNDLEILNYVSSIIYIDGKTTAKGMHGELLSKNGNYRKLLEINKDVI